MLEAKKSEATSNDGVKREFWRRQCEMLDRQINGLVYEHHANRRHPHPTIQVKVTASADGQPLGGFYAQLYWINTADGGDAVASEYLLADAAANPPGVTLRPNVQPPPPHWVLRLYFVLQGNPWAIRTALELGQLTQDRDVHFVLVRNGA